MILCIDSGNSRIKWALHGADGWLESGVLEHAAVGQLALLSERSAQPARIMLANVAGDDPAQAIREALGAWLPALQEVKSGAAAGGVVNLYKEPARLGVDRWCALIGARSLVSGPCLVVMAGTATTIDTLDGEGRFCGGLILPGLELMRRSLARDTAALPLAAGRHAPWPRCTDDAITSGCLEAQAGAIERAFARLPGNASCLLSGGAAGAIAEHLGVPHRQVGNLVLDGLLELAGESPQAHAIGKSNG